MVVYNAVPDLFGKPPSGLTATDKIKITTALLELGHRLMNKPPVTEPMDIPAPLTKFVKEKK